MRRVRRILSNFMRLAFYHPRYFMRALPVAIGSLLVGVAVGVASAYWSVGPATSTTDISAIRGDVASSDVAYPKFSVDSTTHHFGNMQRGTSREHAFQVTNKGVRPLSVEVSGTTCKCTVGDVAGGKAIAPGETVDVTLTWVAKSNPGQFRQTATLKTNDPRARRVELTVEGMVTDVSAIEPKEWFFDKLRPDEDRTESVYLMAYQDDTLEIESATIERTEAVDQYQIEVVEVPSDELPDANAKSGYRIDLTPQGGLALGPIHEWVLLETNLPDAEELRIPIMGTVVGDIEIRGPAAWNDVTSAVHFGDIQSEQGAEVKLFLSIKGNHADQVQFEVAELDPEQLEIEIGETKQLASGGAMVPLTVRVPAGLPPAIRNGTGQGEAGRVVLKTNHPVNPEISFGVRFVIKRASITR